MPILTRKLKNLPSATVLSDTDIFINENETTTQKATFYQLINFICNHSIIKNAFASKSSFDAHVEDNVVHISDDERDKWNDSTSQSHTHANKSILDKLSQTSLDNWDDANSKKHTHTNKAVIDLITEEKINEWNNAASGGDGHTHANKNILDSISQTNINAWNNAANYYAASSTAGGAATKAVGDSMGNTLAAEVVSSSEPDTQVTNGHWLQPY